MQNFIFPLLIGLSAYLILFIWRKCAVQWESWVPVFKKIVKFSLYIAMIVWLLWTLNVLGDIKEDNKVGAAILALVGFGGAYYLADKRGFKSEETHNRGARVSSSSEVKRMVNKVKDKGDLDIGGINLPLGVEPYHFLIAGSTGSGKSVAITNLLDKIRLRGDTALIVDSGGEFLTRYWHPPTDHILNPFDDRCAPWSPTAEMEGPWDAEALAKSIIPNGTGESKEWNSYAQTFLTSCMQALWSQNKTSLKDLMWATQGANMKELGDLLRGTPAQAQLVSEKTFGSIRTIATNYLACYNYLAESKDAFSITKFIKSGEGGFLYLTYRDDQLDSLRNLISCALDIAARAILSLPADPNRRVWLIIDEFASIGKVQSIEAVATKARKMGGCLLIGLQSVAQLKDRYGDNAAQTILSCLSTWLVLRCADADTAEYMSRYIGEEQVTRSSEGQSTSDSGKSRSLSEQVANQRVVMASEIQQLANLEGFLKIAGHYPVCNIKLGFPPKYDRRSDNFLMRDFTAKPMLKFEVAHDQQDQAQHSAPSAKEQGKPEKQVSNTAKSLAQLLSTRRPKDQPKEF